MPGSSRGDGARMDGALFDATFADDGATGSKLNDLRGKMADSGYLDSAIGSIASFVSSKYRKRSPDER